MDLARLLQADVICTEKKYVFLLELLLYPTICAAPGINTRPRQDVRHFPDDILKWIFLNENAWILIKISLKLVP